MPLGDEVGFSLNGQGVQSVAQAADVGNFFQYTIENPVTLPRQQSAMLPIVSGDVKAEKVSIYNQAVQAKHPLSGLEIHEHDRVVSDARPDYGL